MTIGRSGLCHGPLCTQRITERSESEDFCSPGCQARWQAALVGAQPDALQSLPVTWRAAEPSGWLTEEPGGYRTVGVVYRVGDEVTLGDDPRLYHVTAADESHATLTPARRFTGGGVVHMLEDRDVPCDCWPAEAPGKPVRKAWWKPSTWRRS